MLTNCLAACDHLTITVSEIQRDICEKNRHFIIPPLHSTSPSEYRHPLWYVQTRMVSLPDGVKISKISLFVLAQLRNVTDRQTDRQTDGHRVTAKTALWYAKTGMVWLPNGEKVCITVLTEYRRVTNRRTDKRTSCYGSPRYA